ncbi:cupin domain-containing protein [Spirosoma rhododendri]|uniref:Cupin domain-containing protein n=1 Tax=Spirosoma rhododendri TaxID=2728024 RepID=A0A7L5DUX8_9BACT|nr:cupin domain-containing protein [Spirosoma rhododendri]QJD80398.1 cupin domain-containing protein [Spirosoma rhododendri]
MMTAIGDLLTTSPAVLPEELVDDLLRGQSFRVERIVSRGHASPDDFWYDQDEAEWVLVVQGEARLRLETDAEPIELKAGSYINLPAHARHRVEWTHPDVDTIWLAIFYTV